MTPPRTLAARPLFRNLGASARRTQTFYGLDRERSL